MPADNVVAAYSREIGETVLGGPYAITAVLTPTEVLSNYAITNTPAEFTITTKAASVVVAAKTKEYGSADPTLTGALTGFMPADNVVAAYSREIGETVWGGPYAITAVLTPTEVLSNYAITNTPAEFTITTKAASVVVAAKTKEYGSADPTLTGALTGFMPADNVVAAYSREIGETVLGGPYAITAVLTPTEVLSNYAITNTPAEFTITTKAASVVVAAKTKEYGSADPTLTGALTGFMPADNVVAAYSREIGETVWGGPYAITAVLTPTEVLSNYAITNTPAEFTITTKAASVVVAAKTKEYGSADPTLTGALTGFMPADNVVAAYSREIGETVLGGPYAITAVLTPTEVLSNYAITNTPAEFTITTKAASVVVAAKTKEYGSADPTLTGALTGFMPADNVVAAYSREIGETVLGGPYAITAVLTPTEVLSNYAITNTPAEFTITTKAASVVVAAKTKEYGSADPTLTGALTGFMPADNVVAAYSREIGETVLGGPYAITAVLTPTEVLSNYAITNTPAEFTITTKAASVVVAAKTKEYGSADPTLTGALTGFMPADNVVAAYSREIGETVLGGPYAITAVLTPTEVLSNYAITNTPAEFTITTKAASVVVAAKTKEYGSADPTLTGALTGFMPADNVVAAYSREIGETVWGGPYAITAVLTPTEVLSNYAITNTPAEFTITTKAASVTPNAASKFCGQNDTSPLTTGTLTGFISTDLITATYLRVGGESTATTYNISAVLSPSGKLSNYNITYNSAQFTIDGISVDASASSSPVQTGNPAYLSATVIPNVSGVPVIFVVTNEADLAVFTSPSIQTNSTGLATFTVPTTAISNIGVYKVVATAGSGCATSTAYFPVFNPNESFVTGGGWINSPGGALASDIDKVVVGKANFGFVSKYKKGKTLTTEVDGNTEFQFQAGNINFKSLIHEAGSLVISGSKATYRGTGTINGVSGYKFLVVAIDGDWNGGTSPDKFRIKISTTTGGVVYDNQMGKDENNLDATVLGDNGKGGGSIVIHEAKTKAAFIEPEVVAVEPTLRAYPNPFTERLNIEFSSANDTQAILEIYSITSAKLETLFNGSVEGGVLYKVEYMPNLVSSQMVLYKLTMDGKTQVGKMMYNERR